MMLALSDLEVGRANTTPNLTQIQLHCTKIRERHKNSDCSKPPKLRKAGCSRPSLLAREKPCKGG